MITKQKIGLITLPNPHLRQRSKRVGLITDEIRSLVKDMETTVLNWEDSRQHEVGVALAAVQVDHLLRIIVIRNDFEHKEDRSFSVFINPVITKYEGPIQEDYEGCLSVQDIYGKVPRHSKIRIKAININEQEVRLSAEGFLARVIQHEVDHTNGKVFVDYIKDKPEAFSRLMPSGKLEPLNYEQDVKNSRIFW